MAYFFLFSFAGRLLFWCPFFFPQSYTPPHFPGGAKALRWYFVKYANYPSDELALDQNGESVATIYINKAGKVKFVNATGSNPNFNRETKRVLTLMPDWKPAKRGGAAIDTFVTRKFMFSLRTPRAETDSTVTEMVAIFKPVTDEKEKDFYAKLAKKDIERLQRAPVYDQAVKALRDSNYVDAVHLFEKAQRMGEESQDLHYNKGVAYFRLDEIDSACASWQRAARLGDNEALRIFQQKCR